MFKIIKRLRCKHTNQECMSNFYGDFINIISVKKVYRSAWVCKDCGKVIYSEYLEPSCKITNFNLMNKDKECNS